RCGAAGLWTRMAGAEARGSHSAGGRAHNEHVRLDAAIRQVARPLSRALRDPVVWVFVIAGVFEVLTGDPLLHALLLFVVGAVLLGDGVRGRLSPARRRSSA